MPTFENAASSVCLAHLVRQCNGVEPLRRFVAAYRRYPSGPKHDLLLLCKGFADGRLPAEYVDTLTGLSFQTLFLRDEGFDIVPYFAAVRQTNYTIYCFLNSFSVPLDPDWLNKLCSCLQMPGVELVGATGSWNSMASHAELILGLPSAYDGLFERFAPTGPPPPLPLDTLRQRFRAWRHRWQERRYFQACRRFFPPFPSWHVRSNAFALRRTSLLKVRCRRIRTKLDAFRFESGRDSLTAQVLAWGGGVRLVGKDGTCYEPERWPESGTFWQTDQENLLVADNQTLTYARADASNRQFYARLAWGTHARPASIR